MYLKFYAVAFGRKPGIYLTWQTCKRQVNGYKGAKYKSFNSQEEAESYYAKHHSGAFPKSSKYTNTEYQLRKAADEKYKYTDLCLLCERPFKQQKGKCNARKNSAICKSCKKLKKEIQPSILYLTNGEFTKISINELIYIKKYFNCNDVFSFIPKNPDSIYYAKANADNNFAQNELRKSRYADRNFSNEETPSPLYIKKLLGESRELIKISGDKRDPRITFHCKRCNNDFTVKFKSVVNHKGHNCSAIVSSGESVVRDFLNKKHITYLTQRETLKCINPDTGYTMPYDFEIPDRKVIIEVQGEQHRTFIEIFHIDMNGFLYQQKKDTYKKEYAESQGYKVIELWYSDIETGRYKEILEAELCLSNSN